MLQCVSQLLASFVAQIAGGEKKKKTENQGRKFNSESMLSAWGVCKEFAGRGYVVWIYWQ